MSTSTSSLTIGFIGFGTIASSIATGLLSQESSSSVSVSHAFVSERSVSKSSALLSRFGASKVTVTADNQSIVDSSTLIFLCVLPQQYEQTLSSLKLDPDKHTVISLVSTSTLASLLTCSKLPPSRVHKMICLPSVATHSGTCLLTPPSPTIHAILNTLGGCVDCETEKIMTAMMVSAPRPAPGRRRRTAREGGSFFLLLKS